MKALQMLLGCEVLQHFEGLLYIMAEHMSYVQLLSYNSRFNGF
jgi:hypothetical protein